MNWVEQIFDVRCIGCREWGTLACDRCVRHWTAVPTRTVTAQGVPVVALGSYRGGLRSAVLAAKHRGTHAIIRRLGGPLRDALQQFGEIVIIPMPSSRPGLLARGYGLSTVIARTTGVVTADCLVLDDTGSQRGRNRDERRARRMRVGVDRPLAGTRAVIVDDVVTTGASVDAAINACRTAGIRVVGVVVIARARPEPHTALLATTSRSVMR